MKITIRLRGEKLAKRGDVKDVQTVGDNEMKKIRVSREHERDGVLVAIVKGVGWPFRKKGRNAVGMYVCKRCTSPE